METAVIQLLILLAASESGELGDPELSRRIREGDRKAFKTFFEAHHNKLYYFLLKKGVSEAQAKDLIQQAYLYIWEHRQKIDETKSLRSYLFRIAYTRMLNVFRDRKKMVSQTGSPERTETAASDRADEPLERKELNRAIDTAIASMPEKRQTVFRLCFLQEFTYREAAEFMEVSVKTIENHMALALKDLRKDLETFLEGS